MSLIVDLANPVSDSPLNRGLVYWTHMYLGKNSFSESTVADLTNAHPFTITGGTITWRSRNFNGRHVHVPVYSASKYALHNAGTPVTGVPFTMCAWVWATTSTSQTIMEMSNGSNAGHRISTGGSSQMLVSTFTSGGTDSASGTGAGVLSTNTPTWIAGVWAAANDRKLYVNGVQNATNTASRTPAGVNEYRAGLSAAVGNQLAGSLLSCRLYNRALSASEIWRLYEDELRGWKDTLRRFTRRAYVFKSAGGTSAIFGTSDMVFGAGSSTLTGSGALAGTAAEVFGAGSSTLTGVGALSGSSALIFADGTSVLNGFGALAGSGAMVFGSGSSTLVGAGALVGVSDLVFGAGSSTLVGSGALAGSSALTFIATGTLDLPVSDIAGTAALVFGAGSSTLAGAGALAGASALVFTDSGALTGGGDLAGVVTITFDDGASTLVGSGSLAGQVDIVFDDGSSTLTGAGALAGAGAITFGDGSTTLIGTGALAGAAALTFTIAGTLTVPSGALAGTATITLTATGLLSSDNFLLAKRLTFPQQSTYGVVESQPTTDAFPSNESKGIFDLRQTKGKLTPRPATGTLGGP